MFQHKSLHWRVPMNPTLACKQASQNYMYMVQNALYFLVAEGIINHWTL